jgi:hypothetical protein
MLRPGQTSMRVDDCWQAKHESFLNYHGSGKWEQELHESCQDIINEFPKYVL